MATLEPPVAPMLARLERALPRDGYLYEPKWDGFRCLAFRAGAEVDLRSRNQRPLARYFPELVEALLAVPSERYVLDGEIVAAAAETADAEPLVVPPDEARALVERHGDLFAPLLELEQELPTAATRPGSTDLI